MGAKGEWWFENPEAEQRAQAAERARQSYTPAAADVDHRLRVVVTAANADGQSSATSAATDVVSGGDAPVVKTRPTVSGTAVVGEELTADPGTWTGGGVTISRDKSLTGAMRFTPYVVASVEPDVIKGHSGIWSGPFADFLYRFVAVQTYELCPEGG